MKRIYNSLHSIIPITLPRKDIHVSRNEVLIFFIIIICSILFLFENAFSINFFLDDFFFLDIGHANNLGQFLAFFSPFKNYFYRPIPTETLYFIINYFGRNLFFAHSIVFIVYGIGLYYLFKICLCLTHSRFFSYFFVFFYAINFIHVFQLYQLATFIEIALFTFLTISFYFFLQKKYILCVAFFVLALMSKETALLYPLFLLVYTFLFLKINKKFFIKMFGVLFSVCLLFLLIYHSSSQNVIQTVDTYKLQWNIHLITNNVIWYFLWTMGLPNFVPDYMKSVLFKPLPDFWNLMSSQDIRNYFLLLIAFYSLFIPTYFVLFLRATKRSRYYFIIFTAAMFVFFFLFLSPTLPIIHRWMVRLTLPLLFFLALETYILYLAYTQKGYLRFVSFCLIGIYIIMQIIGIRIHESSSLFILDSQVSTAAQTYINQHRHKIDQFTTIYFDDIHKGVWGGSLEIKNVLDTQYFLPVMFPEKKHVALYKTDTNNIPSHTYVIEATDILHNQPLK